MMNMKQYTQFAGNNPFGTQAKMLFHLDRLTQYLDEGDTWPLFMEINLTNNCNMACKWCISENSHEKEKGVSQNIRYPPLYRFLLDFRDYGGKAVTFSGGGEPTRHPEFEAASYEAFEIGFDLGLMTNGLYPPRFNEFLGKQYKWIRFSLDTVDPKESKEWKGVNSVGIVLENLDALRDEPVRIGVNCNISMDHTVKSVSALIAQVSNKCSYIQFRPVLPRYFVKEEKPQINWDVWNWLTKEHATTKNINFSTDKFQDMEDGSFFEYSSCEGHFFSPVLQANGDLDVCMYHPKDGRFTFGNIYEEPFPVIWLGERRREIIDWLREGCNMKKMCQPCCKLNELNKFIDFVRHPDQQRDINFL